MQMQPSKDDIKSYYDNFLDRLKRDHERENPRHTRVKQALKAIIKPGMKVLDIGCGTGITTIFMGELGARVVGVDISGKLIEFAKNHSLHLPDVKYMVEDITRLSLEERFDAVTIIDSLEHIPQHEFNVVLDVITKHCSEDAIIYLNIPDGRFQQYMKDNHPDKLQIIDESYAPDFLIASFKKVGFQVCKASIFGLDVPIQYNEYLFMAEQRLTKIYGQRGEVAFR